jgi:hypothetical protein
MPKVINVHNVVQKRQTKHNLCSTTYCLLCSDSKTVLDFLISSIYKKCLNSKNVKILVG